MVESSNWKVFYLLLVRVIETLQNISICIIESHFFVVSCSNNVLSKTEGVRNWMMSENLLVWLVAHWVCIDTSINMTGDHSCSISRWSQRDTIRLGCIKHTWFVWFKNPHSHLSICQSENQLIWMVFWPSHSCYWSTNWKFVADSFLLSPVKTDFVDENDVITLCNCDFLRIRGKFKASDQVALLSFVWRLGWELVLPLSIFIKEVDWLHKWRCTLSAAPTANFLPEEDQVTAATFFMPSSKGSTFPAYLSFIQNLNKSTKLYSNKNSIMKPILSYWYNKP